MIRAFLLIPVCSIMLTTGTLGAAPDVVLVDGPCRLHKPRWPEGYASLPALRNVSPNWREHSFKLFDKGEPSEPTFGLEVWADLKEIDVDADGVCDLVVTVKDAVSTGGDYTPLTTLYLARKNGWLRVGARTTKRDLPAYVDPAKLASDKNYMFADYVLVKSQASTKPYLIAWNSGRSQGGFRGYRIFEVDTAEARLRSVDKWNGPGAVLYSAFKSLKIEEPPGTMLFDPNIEAIELLLECDRVPLDNPGLTMACKKFLQSRNR